MIKASEAVLITISANKIKRLEDLIRAAAANGEFQIIPSINLDYSDRTLLEQHGYKINRRMVRSHGFGGISDDDDNVDIEEISISWSR